MAKLIFTSPEHAGQSYELILEKTTVGRATGNTLVLPDSSLSATHCEILMNGPEVIVRDLGSRNGTMVNGRKLVNQQSQFKSGQTVCYGSVEARLELDDQPTDDTLSEMTAVHSFGRIMREQQREHENPKPSNPTMKLESSNPGPSADRTATSLTTSRAKEPVPPVASAPAMGQPAPASRKTAVILAILALGLAALLWLWWSGK